MLTAAMIRSPMQIPIASMIGAGMDEPPPPLRAILVLEVHLKVVSK